VFFVIKIAKIAFEIKLKLSFAEKNILYTNSADKNNALKTNALVMFIQEKAYFFETKINFYT